MASVNRYSTIVTWVKVALPLLALALLSTLFLFSRTPDPDAAIPFADVDVAQIAREQRLSQPRFAGTLDDGREVTLIADSAIPSEEDLNQIALSGIEGRVGLSGVDYLVVTAVDGVLNLVDQRASLEGDVEVVTSQGYRLSSDAMSISIGEFRIVSPGEVMATGPGFDLTAGTMELFGPNDAAVLSFTGGVRLLYEPGD